MREDWENMKDDWECIFSEGYGFPMRVTFTEEPLSDTVLDWRIAVDKLFRDELKGIVFIPEENGYLLGFEKKEDPALIYRFIAEHGDEEIVSIGPARRADLDPIIRPDLPIGVPKKAHTPGSDLE